MLSDALRLISGLWAMVKLWKNRHTYWTKTIPWLWWMVCQTSQGFAYWCLPLVCVAPQYQLVSKWGIRWLFVFMRQWKAKASHLFFLCCLFIKLITVFCILPFHLPCFSSLILSPTLQLTVTEQLKLNRKELQVSTHSLQIWHLLWHSWKYEILIYVQ